MMMAILPASLMAGDLDAAMLYGKGEVWLNGSPIPNSSAIFPGDMIETRDNAVGNITDSGSSVSLLPNSLVKFDGKVIFLEHGSVSVASSQGLTVHAGCVLVTPALNTWTQFEVTDLDGKVHIVARKSDVNINQEMKRVSSEKPVKVEGEKRSTLVEGHETDRDEHCKRGTGARTAADGLILDSLAFKVAGAAGGGLLLWLLLDDDDGSSRPPISPSKP
jgi:hypothetical protein